MNTILNSHLFPGSVKEKRLLFISIADMKKQGVVVKESVKASDNIATTDPELAAMRAKTQAELNAKASKLRDAQVNLNTIAYGTLKPAEQDPNSTLAPTWETDIPAPDRKATVLEDKNVASADYWTNLGIDPNDTSKKIPTTNTGTANTSTSTSTTIPKITIPNTTVQVPVVLDQKLTWDDFLKKAEAGAKTTTTYNITIPDSIGTITSKTNGITDYNTILKNIGVTGIDTATTAEKLNNTIKQALENSDTQKKLKEYGYAGENNEAEIQASREMFSGLDYRDYGFQTLYDFIAYAKTGDFASTFSKVLNASALEQIRTICNALFAGIVTGDITKKLSVLSATQRIIVTNALKTIGQSQSNLNETETKQAYADYLREYEQLYRANQEATTGQAKTSGTPYDYDNPSGASLTSAQVKALQQKAEADQKLNEAGLQSSSTTKQSAVDYENMIREQNKKNQTLQEQLDQATQAQNAMSSQLQAIQQQAQNESGMMDTNTMMDLLTNFQGSGLDPLSIDFTQFDTVQDLTDFLENAYSNTQAPTIPERTTISNISTGVDSASQQILDSLSNYLNNKTDFSSALAELQAGISNDQSGSLQELLSSALNNQPQIPSLTSLYEDMRTKYDLDGLEAQQAELSNQIQTLKDDTFNRSQYQQNEKVNMSVIGSRITEIERQYNQRVYPLMRELELNQTMVSNAEKIISIYMDLSLKDYEVSREAYNDQFSKIMSVMTLEQKITQDQWNRNMALLEFQSSEEARAFSEYIQSANLQQTMANNAFSQQMQVAQFNQTAENNAFNQQMQVAQYNNNLAQQQFENNLSVAQTQFNQQMAQNNYALNVAEYNKSLSDTAFSRNLATANYNQNVSNSAFDQQMALYEMELSQNIQAENNAKANVQTIYNLFKTQGMTWDQLTAEQQKQITDLEASAGLPQGILQYADATTTPDWTLLSTNTITESDGSKTNTLLYQNNSTGEYKVDKIPLGGGTTTGTSTISSSSTSTSVSSGNWLATIGNGQITAYGSNANPYGLDVDGKIGDNIISPVSGTVIFAGENSGWGNQVKIRTANREEYWFSHMSQTAVKVGDTITAGTNLGYVGNTGNVIAGAGGDGSHVDITVKKSNGSYYTAKEVATMLTQPETKTVSIEDKAFLATQVKAITGQTLNATMLDQLYSSYSASGLSTGEYIKKFKENFAQQLQSANSNSSSTSTSTSTSSTKSSSGITYDQPVYIPVEERTTTPTTNADDFFSSATSDDTLTNAEIIAKYKDTDPDKMKAILLARTSATRQDSYFV